VKFICQQPRASSKRGQTGDSDLRDAQKLLEFTAEFAGGIFKGRVLVMVRFPDPVAALPVLTRAALQFFESAASCAIMSATPFQLIESQREVKLCSSIGSKDVEAALETARSQNKPLLIDFSAAPA
jgi:hypothetical protein